MLYVVATPIGNLEDITLRALRVLKEVEYILCEDTRVTRILLDHYDIKEKKLISYHQHTDEKKLREILKILESNDAALVTDAGTPGISDPGNRLISEITGNTLRPVQRVQSRLESIERRQAQGGSTRKNTIQQSNITPIPGPSAVIAALSVSGFPTDKFLFKGFIPNKKGREKFLKEALEANVTVVFYESCHRIIKCLEQLITQINTNQNTNQHKNFVVCRELTKKFETIYRGTAEEILEQIKEDSRGGEPRGEFVVILA